MNDLDWLRLGGMIAGKWPDIDFGETDIRHTHARGVYRVILPENDFGFRFEGGAAVEEAQYEYEDIELQKVIIMGHTIGVGYGPKSKLLVLNTCSGLND